MQTNQESSSGSLFSLSNNMNFASNEDNELKKKREEFANDIRTKDRESMLNLKRKAYVVTSSSHQQLSMIPGNIPVELQQQLQDQLATLAKRTFTFEEFPTIIQNILSEDLILQHWGVTGLRKILSVETGPPIQIVIDANLVPKLIEFIYKDISPQLTLEAAWALTNIASGTTQQTQTIIDKGGIAMFVKLLSSAYPDIAEQAVWAIGNIAGDCTQYRDLILKSGGLDPLVKIINNATNKSTVKHGTWSLSNLCRGKPLPDFRVQKYELSNIFLKYVANAIPVLCKVVIEETDQEVLTDACWALSYLSDGDAKRLQTVIDTGVVPTFVRNLDNPFINVLIPTIRILGNICTGDDRQTNYVLQQGLLAKLNILLSHEKKPVRREACWTLSNITAGNEEQISQVIRETQILEKLFMIMKNDNEDVKREACWCIANACNRGTSQDIHFLVQYGLINQFVDLLDQKVPKTLIIILEAINHVLKRGDLDFQDDNQYLTQLESLSGIVKIEKLQKHENREVYEKAYSILEKYYDIELDL